VALALALALAAGLGRTLSAPLAELAERAEALDLDRLDRIFATGRTDEIGAVEASMSRMTRRLRLSVDALRAAERRAATGDLARQINHDVKNGLVPIRNVLRHLSEVAERDPAGLAAIYAERRGTLESSIDYLDQLARNYARLAPALTRTACDVNSLARDVAAAAARPGLDVTTRLDPSGPAIRADPIAVRRVLENLLTNAADAAAGGGGRVELRTERASGDARGAIRITVSDNGRGMTGEELDRAFGDFYTTKPDGTGLGLSVVRRLVADLDGSLRAETAPGEGSRFILEIPAA
jgi:signal transduction histidine kinase